MISLQATRMLLKRWGPVLAPVVVVLLTYYPAIRLGMVWDDHATFERVPFYSDPGFIVDAIRNPLIYFQNYYRPLVVVSFLLQTYFFGVNPVVFHVTSVVLHTLNTGLVALLALRLAPQLAPRYSPAALALLAGLLYGLHPALIEPTAFLSSRFDLMLTFFLLLAFLADVSFHRPLWRAVAVASAFLLAALCKEMALGFPLALPFWHLARARRPLLPLRSCLRGLRERGDLHVYIAVIISGLLYLAIRYSTLGYILQAEQGPATVQPSSTFAHILIIAFSVIQYLRLIFLPFGNINPAHPIPIPFEPTSLHIAYLAVVLLLVAVTGWLMVRRIAGAWLFAAALMSLFPISGVLLLPRPTGAYFAESYLVFPATLFVLASVFLLAEAIRYLREAEPASARLIHTGAATILVLWIGASLVTVRHTIPLWNSDLSLWSWSARQQPDSTLAASNLATAYVASDQMTRAYDEAQRLLHFPNPGPVAKSTAWYILAVHAFEAGRKKEALRLMTLATKSAPVLSEIPTLRAHYLNANGQYQAAAEQARASLKAIPYQSFAHTELGIALLGMGDFEGAIKELRYGARTENVPQRKSLAQRNLAIAERALELKTRGEKVSVQPDLR
jgi:tetratricopeptide (TPR) repeat protein